MAEPTALFWDVGGVLLTNGWSRSSRQQAAAAFGLDWEDFEGRHQMVEGAFELGRLRLDEYLEQTVFARPRPFTRQSFIDFMRTQSQPYPETLAIVERVAAAGRTLLATLNNESLDLNLYRLREFGLRRYFAVFLSSCFLGVRKPDEAMFRLALQISQREPDEVLFIDDRAINVECAARLGMRTIHYRDPVQLRQALTEQDVKG